MIVRSFIKLRDFQAWSGGIEGKRVIIEQDKEREFEDYIQEHYPEGIDETELNDLLWFDREYLFEVLGIQAEDPEED